MFGNAAETSRTTGRMMGEAESLMVGGMRLDSVARTVKFYEGSTLKPLRSREAELLPWSIPPVHSVEKLSPLTSRRRFQISSIQVTFSNMRRTMSVPLESTRDAQWAEEGRSVKPNILALGDIASVIGGHSKAHISPCGAMLMKAAEPKALRCGLTRHDGEQVVCGDEERIGLLTRNTEGYYFME
ncbi:hypothetical protein HPP92_011998 [Vanilla planifolia]|uniref:Uncharacterized protein n=1 Tax=Vanilla planifolia TaxID=51239 RepID=A0A835R420_VANPL|nr:hypothetical protein HPP92_011998 [Vanilla planifolia]